MRNLQNQTGSPSIKSDKDDITKMGMLRSWGLHLRTRQNMQYERCRHQKKMWGGPILVPDSRGFMEIQSVRAH